MNVLVVVLAAAVGACGSADFAQAEPTSSASDTVMLWGPGYSFGLSAYDGWSIHGLDQSFGRIAELRPPAGSAKQAYGYVIVDATPVREMSFEDGIKSSVKAYETANPGTKGSVVSPIRTRDGKVATVIQFHGHQSGREEVVAFIDGRSFAVRIGFVAKTHDEFVTDTPLFDKVVESYVFLGFKIEEKH